MRRETGRGAFFLCCVLLLGARVAGEEEGETGGARVGAGMAVLEASGKEGLRLSPEALRRLGVSFWSIKTTNIHSVPSKSLVQFRDEIGVYRFRDGWFKLIEIRLLGKTPKEARVQSPELRLGDQVVVDGAAFLRSAELDVFGSESEKDGENGERGD